MSRILPPLVAVRAFEAVCRLGSIRRAAAELGVDHAVVSRHVRNLEDHFGIRLLQAGPQGSRPTAEGRRFADKVSLAFDVLSEACEELRPKGGQRELRIWCVPGLAVRWLMPRLKALETLIPGREIVLRPTESAADLLRGEADLEIRFRPDPAPGVRAEVLAEPRFFPVASPAFLEQHGPVETLALLAALPLLHEDSREQWRHWLAEAGLDPVPPMEGPRLWYANVAIEAVLLGRGIALVNRLQVAPELADGRLVELLATDVRIGAYVLQAESGRWNEPGIALVRRWLKAEMTASLGETVVT